jgi:hypothetical protein
MEAFMTAFTDVLVKQCETEFKRFTKSNGKQGHEADKPFSDIVGEYWDAIDIKLTGKNSTPWSAAFISFVVRKAGAKKAFVYGAGHWVYAGDAIRETASKTPGRAFKAFRPEDRVPQVGDIVGRGRNKQKHFTFDDAAACANQPPPKKSTDPDKRAYESHFDVVLRVDRTKNEIEVIGGNVDQTVARKIIALDKNGHLKPVAGKKVLNGKTVNTNFPWIGVLACQL